MARTGQEACAPERRFERLLAMTPPAATNKSTTPPGICAAVRAAPSTKPLVHNGGVDITSMGTDHARQS